MRKRRFLASPVVDSLAEETVVRGSTKWDLMLLSAFRVQQPLTEYLLGIFTSQSTGKGRKTKYTMWVDEQHSNKGH